MAKLFKHIQAVFGVGWEIDPSAKIFGNLEFFRDQISNKKETEN